MRHMLTLFDMTSAEIERVFAITEDLKTKLEQGKREPVLVGHVAALLFEKPSLRTRVSFETGMIQLGGGALFLGAEAGWGKRESIADFARVLSSYVDVIICRANQHAKVEELAQHATCPVVNGLTDFSHPCQALADLYTMREKRGPLAGQKLAYVGDSNNVACSLALACGKLGVQFAVASPPGYQFDSSFLSRLETEVPNLKFEQVADPAVAVRNADAVYTDVWTSMGQESEKAERAKAFASYQVNEALMKHAPREAIFLHCLPAHRGEEVSAGVIDGPQSAVIQQAANRMHVQKGILVWLLATQGQTSNSPAALAQA